MACIKIHNGCKAIRVEKECGRGSAKSGFAKSMQNDEKSEGKNREKENVDMVEKSCTAREAGLKNGERGVFRVVENGDGFSGWIGGGEFLPALALASVHSAKRDAR